MNENIGETSYKETAFGIISRSKLIKLEIQGIKKAWDFVLKKSQKNNILITPDFLKKVHFVGFGWIFPDLAGKYRTVEVKVSAHSPPKYSQIPELMINFCEDLKVRFHNLPKIESNKFLTELITFLAWIHHRFLWIHPFKDYNGRISRLLLNIVLINLNLPLIELNVATKKEREKYVQALSNGSSKNFQSKKSRIAAFL